MALTPKAVDTLRVLIEHRGQLVERDELMKLVWGEVTVEDGNLSVAVSMLRKVLGESSNAEKFIETIPKRGYKFVGNAREVVEVVPQLLVERKTTGRVVIDEELSLSRPNFIGLVSNFLSTPQRKLATLAATTTAVVLAIGAFTYLPRPRSANVGATPINSIAILPFKTIGARKEDAHEGLGLADILITRLSNIKEVRVRPIGAVMSFENQEVDLVSAAHKLQVDAVLEGTIYRTGDKVRVTGRLLRISDQTIIWSGQFERLAQDELQLQNEIALQVVDALALNLSGNEKTALNKRYTESADAYQLYLKGRYHWNKRDRADVSEAERLFRKAIEKDPNFALAYVGLADSTVFYRRQDETHTAILKALELDPNLGEAYATIGFYQTVHEWNWEDAEAKFKKSIELNPGYATAHHWYAVLLGIEGRNDEAKVEMQRALEINPTSHNFLADLGQIYYFNHEYDKAKEYCNRALEIFPNFAFAHGYLFQIYLLTGENDTAIDEFGKLINEQFKNANESTAESVGRQQYIDKMRALYQQGGFRKLMEYRIFEHRNANELNGEYGFASYQAFLGQKEKALDNLEKAFDKKAFLLAWVKADPIFDSLRSEPRYQAILKKMGL